VASFAGHQLRPDHTHAQTKHIEDARSALATPAHPHNSNHVTKKPTVRKKQTASTQEVPAGSPNPRQAQSSRTV